jgi:hypothetical protein
VLEVGGPASSGDIPARWPRRRRYRFRSPSSSGRQSNQWLDHRLGVPPGTLGGPQKMPRYGSSSKRSSARFASVRSVSFAASVRRSCASACRWQRTRPSAGTDIGEDTIDLPAGGSALAMVRWTPASANQGHVCVRALVDYDTGELNANNNMAQENITVRRHLGNGTCGTKGQAQPGRQPRGRDDRGRRSRLDGDGRRSGRQRHTPPPRAGRAARGRLPADEHRHRRGIPGGLQGSQWKASTPLPRGATVADARLGACRGRAGRLRPAMSCDAARACLD